MKVMRWLLLFVMLCVTHLLHAADVYKSLLENELLDCSTIGLYVIDVDSRQVVASHNAHHAMVPASLVKIITAASVMKCYDDTARLYTRVGYTGDIVDDVLCGDVVVQGSIDPSLGHRRATLRKRSFVDAVVNSIEQAGIKTITGHIIVDASCCEHGGYSDWLVEDTGFYYGVACHGINYNGNAYDLLLCTGEKGTQPSILGTSTYAHVSKFNNLLQVGEKDSSFVVTHPYATEALLMGKVPAHRDTFKLACATPDPPLVLAHDLTATLHSRGIVVEGCPMTDRLCQECDYRLQSATTQLYNHASDPMQEMLRVMMYYSDNLYAEALLRSIVLPDSDVVDLQQALDKQQTMWRSNGIDMAGVNIRDGSGMSRKNLLTPRFVATFLAEAYHDEQLGSRYLSLFPVAGRDATVRAFMSGKKLPGRLLIKSGSMNGVLCYAGYYQHDGKTYALALMCNNHTCGNATVRKSYERFLHELFTSIVK